MITIRCPTPQDCQGNPCRCQAMVTDDDGQAICYLKFLPNGRLWSERVVQFGGLCIGEALCMPITRDMLDDALNRDILRKSE